MNERYRIAILGVTLASAGIISAVQSLHQPMEPLKADNAARLYERVGIASIDSIGSGKTTMTLVHGSSFEAEIDEIDPEGNMGSNGYLRNIDSFQAVVSISFNGNVKDATVYGGNSFGSYSEVEEDLDTGDYDVESQVEYIKIEWDFSLNWNDAFFTYLCALNGLLIPKRGIVDLGVQRIYLRCSFDDNSCRPGIAGGAFARQDVTFLG